jgi:hypothetical protein
MAGLANQEGDMRGYEKEMELVANSSYTHEVPIQRKLDPSHTQIESRPILLDENTPRVSE